jgi:hypothetical protein
MKLALVVAFVLPVTATSTAVAGTIDFELVPSIGVPSEGLQISNQYLATEGISFSLEGGGFPRIAEVGNPRTAFGSSYGGDTPAPGQEIGSFFLTDDGVLSGLQSPALIVTYDTPTAEASGVILDLDFDETFTIQPLDISGAILDTITISAGDPDTGDGIATNWLIDRRVNEIYSIRFKGTRQASGAFGLGFDNFNARSADPTPPPISNPAPGTLGILGLGLAGLFFGNRRAEQSQRLQAIWKRSLTHDKSRA